MYIISACLCGVNCKYNGKNNINEKCVQLVKEGKALPVCPEQLGGLTTPRTPAEIKGYAVINKDGIDVSKNYNKGAMEALKIAKLVNADKAILKDGSPSCGSSYIYDGTFTGKKISQMGVTAKLFKKNNIEVQSENTL